jgi:alpha-N-arabinofuranosidase
LKHASAVLSPAFTIGAVDRRLFGSFLEHMGRAVYGGIYEPGHPLATGDGFRTDVLELVKELGVTAVRYPGGNFVSGYKWEDGVGPVEERPARIDLAWATVETNAFGLNEFGEWAAAAEVEPVMALNLGTRGVLEAIELLDYANGTRPTALAQARAAHGHPAPHGIRVWCLGNELDGEHQIGHKTAEEYGRLAAETARAMKMADPGLELVACGSSASTFPTFGHWEAEVLEHTFDLVDYISAHAYYEEAEGDPESFLASGVDMDRVIDTVIATADAIALRRNSPKRINISFDEWNVWYRIPYWAAGGAPKDWQQAPRLIEDTYNVTDAVVVGGLLISLLRHADRVTMACLAQLVNVIAPIRAEPGGPAWRQTTFHPFALTAEFARGTSLQASVTSGRHSTAMYGDVDDIDLCATLDESTGAIAVFVVNRTIDEPVRLQIDLSAFGEVSLIGAIEMHDEDRHARNTESAPDRVTPHPADQSVTIVSGTQVEIELLPVSWTVLRFRAQESV